MGKKYSYNEVKEYAESKGCVLLSEKYKSCKDNLEFVGICGHKYFSNFDMFKNGERYRCSKCSKQLAREKTSLKKEYVVSFIESKGCKLLSNEYKNCYEDLDILFACGHVAKRTFTIFKRSDPYCYNCIRNVYTLDIIENKLKEKGYTLLSRDNAENRIEIEDSEGYRYNTGFNNFVSSIFKEANVLYKFHPKNPFTTYNIKKFLEINIPTLRLVDGEKWVSNLKKMNFIDQYGYKFFVVFGSINNGYYPNKFSNSNPYLSENIDLFLKLNNKNFVLLPNQEVKDVNDILSFKCNICDNDEIPFRKTFISIQFGDGCPYCSGKKAGNKNNLLYLYPELCKEWDYELNKILPNEITSGTPKKVWWVCPNCNYSYFSSICKRTKDNRGCPKCCESHLEKKISKFLNDNNILYEPQKRFDDCKDILSLPFDFYMIDYNILCEAQGKQHFSVSEYFGGEKGYEYRKKHDNMKKEYCKRKNIELIEIAYWDLENVATILSKRLNLQRKEENLIA